MLKTVQAQVDLVNLVSVLSVYDARQLILMCEQRIRALQESDAHARELTDLEKQYLHNNPCLKVQAVKSIRNRLSCGLKEAKDIADAYCAANVPQHHYVYRGKR